MLAERSLAPIRSSARPPTAINILSKHSGGRPSPPALSPAKLDITYKSTYGQSYLPSPLCPSPALRARG